MFIGLENINPDSLIGAKKKQNHIADYRDMLLAWRKRRASPIAAISSASPATRRNRSSATSKIIQRELPLDILQFSCLTPLPGSEDHAKMAAAGAPIDPDLNKFDLEHAVSDHPRMSRAEWQDAYRLAWRTYYTDAHMKTVIRRAAAGGPRADTVAFLMVMFWAASTLYRHLSARGRALAPQVSAATAGRACGSRARSLLSARGCEISSANHARIAVKFAKIWWFFRGVLKDPNARDYADEALRTSSDYERMEMFQLSDSARAAGAKARRIEERSEAPAQ